MIYFCINIYLYPAFIIDSKVMNVSKAKELIRMDMNIYMSMIKK